MPKIYKRAGTELWWCRVRGLDGRASRKSTGCRDREAALIAAARLEREAADPAHAAAAATSLEGAVIDYLADLDRRGRSDATKKIARQKIGHFIRVWGPGLPLSRISPRLVTEYIDKRLGEGVVKFTVKKELGHLGQVLTIARYHGTFSLPLEKVLPPYFSGEHRPRKRALSAEETGLLLGELRPDRRRHVAWILATGCRLGESFRASLVDVDRSAGVVRVHGTKTSSSDAHVPITRLSESLLDIAVERAPRSGPMFAAWGKVQRDIAAACKRAGIEACTPNDLRRTFGTMHREAGLDIQTVSKMLRHSTDKLAQTTYANVGGEPLAKLVRAKLDATVPNLYPATAPSAPPGGIGLDTIEPELAPPGRFELPPRGLGNRLSDPSDPLANTGGGAVSDTATVPFLYATATWLGILSAHFDHMDELLMGEELAAEQTRGEPVHDNRRLSLRPQSLRCIHADLRDRT